MASSKPVPCGLCKQEKVNTKADIWCYNCDEGLCSSCSGHHKKFKSTRDHKTIDIHIYKPPIGSIKTECDKHNQQFKLYCPGHLTPSCVTVQTSKLQSFLTVHQIEEKVHQYQRYVEHMENNDMAIAVGIQIKQNSEIENIRSDLQSLKSFGEVEVSKTEIAINRERSVKREAQVETRMQSHIDKNDNEY
ncbi:TRIM66 [Mytilus edulis]|uniref:TRIM66 n=1 Tax=Mytilus edulis TaxID=6550 RepID=A0A8S3Q1N4_MYTED|nr:TRIM66 [Mytilus edulis]